MFDSQSNSILQLYNIRGEIEIQLNEQIRNNVKLFQYLIYKIRYRIQKEFSNQKIRSMISQLLLFCIIRTSLFHTNVINAQSIANITFDIRQMFDYNTTLSISFGYETNWDVTFNNSLYFQIIDMNFIKYQQKLAFLLGEANLQDSDIKDTDTTKANIANNVLKVVSMPTKFTEKIKQNVEVHKFTLYSLKDQKLVIAIRIFDKDFTSLRLNFMNSVSVGFIQPFRADYDQQKSFAFYISGSNKFTVPINTIPLNNLNASNYLISYQENFYNLNNLTLNKITDSNLVDPDQYFQNKNGIFMPHIPYFSNCREFGSMGFFYQITESVQKCNLIDPENVYVIDPFKFGDKPFSDECEDVTFNCVFDEYLQYKFSSQTWYQQPIETALFQITPFPINMNADDLNTDSYSDQDLVEIQTESEIPSNKLPKKVVLTINYYQVMYQLNIQFGFLFQTLKIQISTTEKQIISGSLNFESFIEPQKEELVGNSTFSYQLVVSWHSMSQSELTIAFALDIQVYLIMYFIIGSVSVVSICIFAAFHAILRRKKGKIQQKVWELLVLIYPSALYGTYLTIIPTGLILILNLLIMGGQLWDYPFNILSCDPQKDDCQITIFDSITDDIDYADNEIVNLRNGRCAISIIVIGLYIMNLCADLLISQSKHKIDRMLGSVSFDGNVWYRKYWEKSYFLFFYIAMAILMVVIINWSLSNDFGTHVWYYICTIKILGMLSEILGEMFFPKKHLLAPVSTGLDCVLDIATLGANDFFDFLLSFYIEQGIQMLERTYVSLILEYSSEYISHSYAAFKQTIQAAWEKNQIEDLEDTMPDYLQDGVNRKIDEISMSNSNIVLSDRLEDSFESEHNENLIQPDEQQEIAQMAEKPKSNQKKIQSATNKVKSVIKVLSLPKQKSFDEDKDLDTNEISIKSHLDSQIIKKQLQRKQFQDAETLEKIEKQQKEALLRSMKSLTKQKEEIDTTSSECIGKYSDFVNGMIGPLVLPIIVAECWIFYNQNNLANDYNIERKSYVYYFLFSIMIIPFRIAIDIVYFHIWVYYHDVDFSIYAAKVKKRFEQRRKIWKADQTTSESDNEDKNRAKTKETEQDEENEEEIEFKDLDKWCFSSQYYFVQAFFLIGLMQVVIGIYGVTSSKYNVFSDYMLVPILILWFLMCVLVQKICLFGGKHLGIWKVKKTESTESNQNSKDDIQKSEDHTTKYEGQQEDLEMRMFQISTQQINQQKKQKYILIFLFITIQREKGKQLAVVIN